MLFLIYNKRSVGRREQYWRIDWQRNWIFFWN